MDLDELEGLGNVPSRTTKFAPGRAVKHKPKVKPEPAAKPGPKPEPVAKPESAGIVAPLLRKRENEANENAHTPPKIEPAVLNGAVKVETDTKMEKEGDQLQSGTMEEDSHPQQVVEEEEEDTVVREIDVFFKPSQDANAKIYVFQYPLRPCWRPYELDERCEEVRLKPATSEVEVDLSIDVDSKNYDKELGSKMKMTKQTLSTKWMPAPTRNYAIGFLVGDKLHLNPVHTVVQLRPSMQHLSGGNKKRHAIAAKEEGSSRVSMDEPAGSSKKQNKGVDPSTDQKTANEEHWVHLKFHALHSDLSTQYMRRMLAAESGSLDFNMSPSDYMNSLCSGGSIGSLEQKFSSKRVLLSMSLEERLRKLLCEGPPFHRFSALKHFAPDDSIEDVLEILQRDALLVQGLWTLKTKLLSLDPALSFARDYVLVLFNRSTTIASSQVDAAGRNRDRVKEILKILAIERPVLNDWKLKEAVDVSFLKHYPGIVKKQQEVWQNMEDKVMALIRGVKKRGG